MGDASSVVSGHAADPVVPSPRRTPLGRPGQSRRHITWRLLCAGVVGALLGACGGGADAAEDTCAAAGAFLVQVDEMFSGPPPADEEEADRNREQVRGRLQDLVDAAERVSDGADLAEPARRSLQAAEAAFGASSPQEGTDRFQDMFDAVAEVTAACDEREVPVPRPTPSAAPTEEQT